MVMAGNGTVLLADDSEDDVLLMRCAFSRAGFDNPIAVAEDGQELIDYLRGEGRYADRETFPIPILILLDVKLPRVDGLGVLRWLRQQPQFRELPVVTVSGSAEETLEPRARALGARSHLRKPVAFRELVKAVEHHLDAWLHHRDVADIAA
jgi:CheY-like chemotaxis protein